MYYRFLGLEYKSRMEKHFTQESSRRVFSYINTNREQEERQRLCDSMVSTPDLSIVARGFLD